MMWENKFVKHSFKSIDIELVNGEWKKKPKGIRPEWQNLTETSIKKGDRAIALLTGQKSGTLVLDFDSLDLYEQYCMDFPELRTVSRVLTRKGFHLYFLWNDKYTDLPSKIDKLDIQGNGKQVFYPGTNYTTETGQQFTYKWEIQTDELCELPNQLFLNLKKPAPKKVKESNTNFEIECNDKLWKDIIENINIKYIDTYDTWFKIMCGVYAIGKEANDLDAFKEVARSLSIKSKKYDKTHKEFEQVWLSCGKYSFTGGSVRYYSRISNETNYLSICKRKGGKDSSYFTFDEKLLSDYFTEAFGDNIICNYGKIYIYFNDKWILDQKGTIIQRFLCQQIRKLYTNIIDELNKELQSDTENQEIISSRIKDVSKILTNYGNQKNKNVWGLIYNEIITRNIDKDIFDTNNNLFIFNNKAYDFLNNKWVYVSKFDYILTTCGNEYTEPTKEQLDKVSKLINDIFPNPEIKRAYISILRSGLTGHRLEKFIIASGEGRNGKGFINDFYQYLQGDYYGILHLSLLTKEIKGGANTELRNIHKKRFLKATEPDSGSTEKLRMANIKALTGESTLKARGLYENDFDISILATFLMECNKLPFVSMDGNEAERQRMVIIPFETTFTDNQEDLDSDINKYKPIDLTLKDREFKEEHYCALFKYIVDTGDDKVYIPEMCKNLALKWMLDKDDFVGWFMENYEECPDSIISIKELHMIFKNSSFFSSMTKAQQRQNNLKAFKEVIQCKLRHLYVPVKTYINGRQITQDSIKGYKLAEPETDIDFRYDPE